MRNVLTATIDARALAVSRILIGIGAILITDEWARVMLRGADGATVQMPAFSWIPPASMAFVFALTSISLLSGALMVVGVAARTSAALVATCGFVAILVELQTWSNHLALLVLLATFLAMSGAGETLALRRGRAAVEVPYWPAFLIKVLVSTVYFWAAISKINSGYLSGDVISAHLNGLVPLLSGTAQVGAIGSIVLELFLAFALWIPLVRILAFIGGAILHLAFIFLLTDPWPLVAFAVVMAGGYAPFVWDARFELLSIVKPQRRAGGEAAITS